MTRPASNLNYTCTAVLILTALYFAGRIGMAFITGQAQQRIHAIESAQPRMRPVAQQSATEPGPVEIYASGELLATCNFTDEDVAKNCQLAKGKTLDDLVNGDMKARATASAASARIISQLSEALERARAESPVCPDIRKPSSQVRTIAEVR